MTATVELLKEYWYVAVLSLVAIQIIYRQWFAPLHEIPGPWLARHTRLWKLMSFATGRFHLINLDLHKKYGPIVRIAPGEYSLAGQDALRTIYGAGHGFVKSNWYRASQAADSRIASLFTVRDEKWHGTLRRKYANAFSLTALLEQEPYVDSTTKAFVEKMDVFATTREPIDYGLWLRFYAFDVIGELTFAKRLGFIDNGADLKNILGPIDVHFWYSSLVGVYWQFHPFLIKTLSLLGVGSIAIMQYAAEQTKLRLSEKEDSGRKDFLSRFVSQHKKDPLQFTEDEIRRGCLSNITAGSDTTAISLRAIFYHLMKNPHAMRALQNEVDTYAAEGKLSSPALYKEAQNMPYLQAVIKEALRCHGATGIPLERIVPPEGTTIYGKQFRSGDVVGVNSWVAHYDTAVFGDDALKFRPERWLVPENEYRIMDRSFFAFGSGSRTCIGKNISLMEISKLLPELIRRYDFELVDPKADWKIYTAFFVRQEGLYATLSHRNKVSR